MDCLEEDSPQYSLKIQSGSNLEHEVIQTKSTERCKQPEIYLFKSQNRAN
jgi:hypothetical protein